jgi:Na+-translocating ferredoxin:NAD+ oxidoreductase subunit A
MELIYLLFSTAIIHNFVLTYFLGICPFIGVSNKISSAFSLGLATIFVMTITSMVSWLIYNLVLVPYNLTFLQIPAFILIIASLVQLG